MALFGVEAVQIVNGWPMKLPFFGFNARLAGYLDSTKTTLEEYPKLFKSLIEKNVNIIAFPEGTRSGSRNMNSFHSGVFRLAMELGIPVYPCCIAGNERFPRYLEEADYWATTGLLFIYLVDPTQDYGPIGRYATIAVMGATGWQAPYWIGQPVQWCGLVYRNSLLFYSNLLKDKNERNYWQKVATGITITGLQESFQLDDKERQGLLPDYYILNAQQSDGPAINPGTVQNGLAEAYNRGNMFGKFPICTGSLIHLLGTASHIKGDAANFSADLQLWPKDKTEVLVSGIPQKPIKVTWNSFVNEGLIDGLVVMAVNWKRQDPFGSTLAKYREIMDFCQGKCQVFFAVQGYNFTHKGVQEYVEATKLPAREVAQKLLDITREVQADGVVLECVDYRNYAFFPAAP